MIKLKKKRVAQKITALVDKFDLLWSMVISFPDLS